MIERLETIDIFTQVVALPGRNDGDALGATLAYLAERPNVQAVAVVPVGLTDHRVNLPTLAPYTPEQAAELVDQVEAFAAERLAERGTRFVFLSDEFYLTAGRPLPQADAYEGFVMLENGVGMVRDFLGSGYGDAPLPARLPSPRRVICATGKLFAPVLREALAPLAAIQGLDLEVRAITNRSFGAVTTVAGLLAGRDLLTQIAPGEADLVLLSPSMLKYGTEMFLDERSLADVRGELAMDVAVGGRDLRELVETILAGPSDEALHSQQFGFSTHAVKEAARQH